ncbi:uncharacterized protein OCT59_012870 [Rhizophagus irregularis]|uniref:uncharacterized protein n=1 Tax=Rhizophagus irregularis TaxID=588596 RepID=UPI0019F09CDF|nr:hypothetical protein OCT59_012870 [Rhizophagus irregularis]GBC31975.2 hypothetical protein RIR_jg33375.t1 [Rhizophagus irregularis DAOM 181602=DAOM 197198]
MSITPFRGGVPELVEVNICEKIINNIKAERYNTQLRSQNANNIKFGRVNVMKRYLLSDTACFVKMRSVNINCLVLGKPFRNIISIKIKENETIGELKRRIKAEKDYFDTIGASDLRLWRTNTHIWKEDPPKSNLHVVIKIEVVALNCIISGYPSDTYYPIEISVERNVGELKSMIKKRWKPLFSHIVSNELKLMAINIPPNQVITYEEDKCVMKNLDKIKSVFANSIYNYNPDHLHVMISSDTWKEVHCKAIYKKTIYEKHENNSNGRSLTQRAHDGNIQGEFIRSDSMLERIMWGKFYRIDSTLSGQSGQLIFDHGYQQHIKRILGVQETTALIHLEKIECTYNQKT